MDPTTLSDQSKPKSAAVSMTVGILEVLDGNGQPAGTWRLTQPRCTIGSSNESLICIDDSSMAAVHTLIAFGKNHTLIRAMGGQVRVSGRSVREWLIDEPTAIQCGATRFVVYPPGYHPDARNASHRVLAGSVADQASRLRTASAVHTTPLNDSIPLQNDNPQALEPTSEVSPPESPSNVAPPPSPPAFVVAKLDPDVVKTAMEPLHLALQAASDGILELTRRANESAAQIVDIPPINNNLNEMTQAIETLEDRVNSISSYCENLLSNVTESIEGRMSRFDELLLKLAERPDVTATHDPSKQYLHADDGYNATALSAYQTQSEIYHQEPSQEAFVQPSDADNQTYYEEPVQQHVEEQSPSYVEAEYPEAKYNETAYQESEYQETSYEETSYDETIPEQNSNGQTSYHETIGEVADYEPPLHADAAYESSTYEDNSVELSSNEEVAFNEHVEPTYAPAEPSYFSEMRDLASSQFTEEETIDESQSYLYEARENDETEFPNIYAIEPSENSYESEVTPEASKFDFNDYPSQFADAADPAEQHKAELPSWFTEAEPEAGVASSIESSSLVGESDSAWSTAQLNPIYAEDSNGWLKESEAEAFQEIELELVPSDLNSLTPIAPLEDPASSDETFSEETSSEEASFGSAFGGIYDDETTATTELESEPEVVYEEVDAVTIEEEGESEESEESIEDYMARLLQRVKGGPDTEEAPSKAASKATKSRETIATVSPVTEPLTNAQAPVSGPEIRETRAEPVSAGEFAPRQAAPEKSVDLAALRNLANDTARQALHNSSRKKNELVLIGKIAIAVLGLGGGILLLVLNGFRANVAMIGMIASFVVFLLWGYEAVVQYKFLQASKAKEASDNENSENRPVSSHTDGV